MVATASYFWIRLIPFGKNEESTRSLENRQTLASPNRCLSFKVVVFGILAVTYLLVTTNKARSP